jgi:hypothetical protein
VIFSTTGVSGHSYPLCRRHETATARQFKSGIVPDRKKAMK